MTDRRVTSPAPRAPRAALLMALLASCPLGAGCDTSCDTGSNDDNPVQFRGGRLDTSGSYYETAPIHGPRLYFPADRRIDIFHGLGTDQLTPQAFLSFEPCDATDPCDDGEAHAVALPSGNHVVMYWDAEKIAVHNNTCAQFYLRLTAEKAGELPADGGRD